MLATNNNNHGHTLVMAGCYSEYLSWRKTHPAIKSCKYVERLEDIQGLNGFVSDIILFGNYEDNPVYNTTAMHKLLLEMDSPFRSYIR